MLDIFKALVDHMVLLALALAFTGLISLFLLIVVEYWPKFRYFLFPILSLIYTIPSLALFVFLIPILGIGRGTAVLALSSYGSFLLTTGMVTALDKVDPNLVEAGYGLGYSDWQVFWRIKLVYGLPAILASLRLTTLTLASTATIAAVINGGGLGRLIFEGISQQRYDKMAWGSVSIVVLIFVLNSLLTLMEGIARDYVRGRLNDN